MSKSPARLAASGLVCALLVAGSAARAGEPPRAPRKHETKAAHPSRGASEAGARRTIAGGPTSDDAAMGAESPDLRALREAEKELFPPAAPAPGDAWPSDLPMVLPDENAPRVHASGLPPAEASAPE